ncbi:MAG: hypothetical protein M1365_11955 [Actinobacteria bacterium]|nr:hypothetical protein [Actinomycetota bacterium]
MDNIAVGIKVESDFRDYYDHLSIETGIIYKRYRIEEGRGKSLAFLNKFGIKTIELKAARQFDDTAEKLVVYYNPKLHDSKGKLVVPINEARIMYENNLASRYYSESNGEYIKFLQVGKRRFRVNMKIPEKESLSGGIVVSIQELESLFNYYIMQPIFSIDYISSGKEMLATDYNSVQSLMKLGFESIMSPKEVMDEIKQALISYNKI